MRLILSCIGDVNSVTNKDHLVLLVNTKTREIEWIPLNISEFNGIVGSKALCMSGDYLIVSLKIKEKIDKMLVIDVVTEKNRVTACLKSKDIHGMVSVFRGRIYGISTGTDIMSSIVLSPSSNNVIRDVVHYSFDGGGNDTYHINSIVSWNRRWYVSCFGKNWREDSTNGTIIELSKNNRIVYSNIDQPNSLFFNRNDEMCFCESNKGLFHFGRKIVKVGGYPRGVIEDYYDNGYWVGLSSDRGDIPAVPARLRFINNEGVIGDEIVIPHTHDIYDMVEAQGYLSKLL
jgi:hypothetical protein